MHLRPLRARERRSGENAAATASATADGRQGDGPSATAAAGPGALSPRRTIYVPSHSHPPSATRLIRSCFFSFRLSRTAPDRLPPTTPPPVNVNARICKHYYARTSAAVDADFPCCTDPRPNGTVSGQNKIQRNSSKPLVRAYCPAVGISPPHFPPIVR